MSPFWWYLLAINAIAFCVMGIDKSLARGGRRRVPERTLHALALVGGIVGSFAGIRAFRHKSRKPSFLVVHAIILGLQVAAVVGWFRYR
jgi:uncharacterized membrane protein YsdA (DUF1294 family)